MVRKGSRSGASSASAATRAGGDTFTSFAAATAAALSSATSDAAPAPQSLSEWDTRALSLLKSTSKKDATTRSRALADLAAMLAALPDPRPPPLGRPFVTAWGARFGALAADGNVAVRGEVLAIMGRIVQAFGKASQPILKTVLPCWVAALGDSAALVVKAAKASLEIAFPSETVRRRLVRVSGDAVGAFCVAECEAVKATGDEEQLRRIVAAARWTVDESGTLDHVAAFLDDGILLKIGVGVKVSKKGVQPVSAAREACEFARGSVVPLLAAEAAEFGFGAGSTSSRTAVILRLAESVVKAGESAGWDLLLGLMNTNLREALGDWQSTRAAIRATLKSRGASQASLSALLPFFSLLPSIGETGGEISLETAEDVLNQLRLELLPTGGERTATGHTSAGHGLKGMYVNAALPAYLECMAYSVSQGAARWSAESVSTSEFIARLSRDHLEPALVSYLTGGLYPPTAARRATRPVRNEATGRRPVVSQHSGVTGNFASAVAAFVAPGHNDIDSFAGQVSAAVLPTQGGSLELTERVSALVELLFERPNLEEFACALASRLVAFVLSQDVSAIGEAAVVCDVALMSGLSRCVPISQLVESASVSPAGVFEFALKAVERFPNNRGLVDTFGSVSSWTTLVSTSTEARSDHATNTSDLIFKSVCCSATLSALQIRSVVTSVVLSHGKVEHGHRFVWAPLACEYLDTLVLESLEIVYGEDDTDSEKDILVDPANDQTSIPVESAREHVSFLMSVLDPTGGAVVSSPVLSAAIGRTAGSFGLKEDTSDAYSLCKVLLSPPADGKRALDDVTGMLERLASAAVVHCQREVPVEVLEFRKRLSPARQQTFLGTLAQDLGIWLCSASDANIRDIEKVSVAERCDALGKAWVLVVTSLGLERHEMAKAHSEAVKSISVLLRGAPPCSHGPMSARRVFSRDIFAASVIVAAGVDSALPSEGGCIDGDIFVHEYLRTVSLESSGFSKLAGKLKELMLAGVKISKLSSTGSRSQEPCFANADELALICVSALLKGHDAAEFPGNDSNRQAALLGLLRSVVELEACSRTAESENTVWSTVESASSGVGVVMSDVATRIVSVCSIASGRASLASFRRLFDEAVLAVRRGASDGSPRRALLMLASALDTLAADGTESSSMNARPLPSWFSEQLSTALRAVRRTSEMASLGGGGGSRNCVGPGALLVARAISSPYELSPDDWRFWSFAALDALRGAQLLEAKEGDPSTQDVCYMAQLASAMVRCEGFETPSASLGASGAGSGELIRNGAWAGVNLLRGILETGTARDCSGLIDLMFLSVRENLVIEDGRVLPKEPQKVYELLPLLCHVEAQVRCAVFGFVTTVACDDLPRFMEAALLRDERYASEEEETRAMRELVPEPIRDALVWPDEADPENASYPELGFFLAWLLFFEAVKGANGRRQGHFPGESSGESVERGSSSVGSSKTKNTEEDRSFRRVSLNFLQSSKYFFASFFARCIHVVIDGTVAEKAAAAAASSSISETLSTWIMEMDTAAPLDVQVGQCAGAAFAHALQLLPALSRQHIADHVDHGLTKQVEDVVRRRISPLLISEEIRKVREWSASDTVGTGGVGGEGVADDGDGELSTRGSVAAREVWASYTLSEVTLEVALKLPETFPLHPVEVEDVEGNSRIGKALWRKTLLQMTTLLRAKDGSLAEAIGLWRRSLDLRLGGLEDCPVCYSVLHLSNSSLPSGMFWRASDSERSSENSPVHGPASGVCHLMTLPLPRLLTIVVCCLPFFSWLVLPNKFGVELVVLFITGLASINGLPNQARDHARCAVQLSSKACIYLRKVWPGSMGPA